MAPFSLKEITDAWGTWKGKQMKTRVDWVEAIKYSNKSQLNAYHQNECKATFLYTTYGENSKPPAIPVVVQEAVQNNDTELNQSMDVHYTAERATTATWSVTNSLKIGISLTVKTGIKEIFDIEETITVERDISTTETKSTETTRSWFLEAHITVPPRSSVKTQVLVNERSVETPYKSKVELKGHVAIWFNNPVFLVDKSEGHHYLWFIPIEKVFAEVIQNNIISTEGYQIAGDSVVAIATGTFKGAVGLSADISNQQVALQSKPVMMSMALVSKGNPALTTKSVDARDQPADNEHQE